ncbi:hypothetical protein [Actinokineospora diospyrosa]|uniref:Mce-associated membrane protein n=1 Tax=Actinokineospora diospyrosa TaxID=103728 RepID=A0ABT1IHF3_9PSEU|nr:hypothetical protein [Actinokineospora diospyrosa]MCP2272039.1 Mce-associated membrane protein [Actinokineospora diospyrosa]
MPTPPRRRTPAAGPTRRPRVAGLRKPSAPAPETPGTPDEAIPAEPALTEPALTEPALTEPAVTEPAVTEPEPAPEPEPEVALGQPVDLAAPARAVPAPAEPAPDRVEDQVEDQIGDQVVADGVIGAEPVSRPTGKRREAGTPVPARIPEVLELAADTEPKRSGRGTVLLLLVLLTVLFTAGALYFKGQYDSKTSGVDSTNEALVNAALTSEVTGRLTVAVERTLSYSYTDLDANAQAVKETLAGTATCEYDKLFGQVRKLAPEQKLVLTTKVRKIGVTRLAGDKADLLVFVDQSTTRADQNQTTASGAVFGVRAEKVDGAWKITDFDMLDQALPGGQQATGC